MAVAKVIPGKTRLGWIGTGVMGSSMCGHLLAGALPSRSITAAARGRGFAGQGANWADTPKAVAAEPATSCLRSWAFPATCAR